MQGILSFKGPFSLKYQLIGMHSAQLKINFKGFLFMTLLAFLTHTNLTQKD